MAATVSVLGIRHHGPGSARILVRALDALAPGIVLVEGPPDASDVVSLAAHDAMVPPVALVVYEPDTPSSAVYYPFAVYSPEWQALRWGLGRHLPVRFIDLPQSLRPRHAGLPGDESEASSPGGVVPFDAESVRGPRERDPLEALAEAAGFTDAEMWWGRLIEERHAEEDPIGLFEAIRDAMTSVRESVSPEDDGHDRPAVEAAAGPGDTGRYTWRDREEALREAHMRKCIRAALKEGFERIAVICGAWHAPALTTDAIEAHTARADDGLLRGLARRKTAATWIPWTHDRLCLDSGYGAGVASPGWYEHLWVHGERNTERWVTRVARLMRDEDLDASPASIIETVRLAETLASLRGRRSASLEELGEATLAVLCHGNPTPLLLVHRTLIVGQRLGAVPDDAPAVPLQRDLASQQKSLRLKVSADEITLDLDQRKEIDLNRSRLLHRLRILGVDWGELNDDRRQLTSTFHEIWQLQWRPELAVRIIEAARWGNTVADAAAAAVADRAANARDLGELTEVLDHVILADLPGAVERLVARIQAMSAVSTDVGHLMEALPALARVLRYGNVRKTDAGLVQPLVSGLLARVAAGLLPACASLDDEAAEGMRRRMEGVHGSLSSLNLPELSAQWRDALARVGDADVHGVVAGRAIRLLLDAGTVSPEDAAGRLSFALSRGNDPSRASAWLEGFLSGSGLVLVHDERLLGIVDRWLCGLSRDAFEQVCPIARRTFATFERPERRQIGERIKRGASVDAAEPRAATDDYDPERGSLVEPILQLILGTRESRTP